MVTHSTVLKGVTYAGLLNARETHIHVQLGPIPIPVLCCIVLLFTVLWRAPHPPLLNSCIQNPDVHTLFCSVPIVLPFYHSGIGAVLPNKHMLPGIGEFQLAGLLPDLA